MEIWGGFKRWFLYVFRGSLSVANGVATPVGGFVIWAITHWAGWSMTLPASLNNGFGEWLIYVFATFGVILVGRAIWYPFKIQLEKRGHSEPLSFGRAKFGVNMWPIMFMALSGVLLITGATWAVVNNVRNETRQKTTDSSILSRLKSIETTLNGLGADLQGQTRSLNDVRQHLHDLTEQRKIRKMIDHVEGMKGNPIEIGDYRTDHLDPPWGRQQEEDFNAALQRALARERVAPNSEQANERHDLKLEAMLWALKRWGSGFESKADAVFAEDRLR